MAKNGHDLAPGSFTDTEIKILRVLEDGLPHGRWELWRCLPDRDYVTPVALRLQLHYLRKKLEPHGQTILCQYHYRQRKYRWVRLLRHHNDGRR